MDQEEVYKIVRKVEDRLVSCGLALDNKWLLTYELGQEIVPKLTTSLMFGFREKRHLLRFLGKWLKDRDLRVLAGQAREPTEISVMSRYGSQEEITHFWFGNGQETPVPWGTVGFGWFKPDRILKPVYVLDEHGLKYCHDLEEVE